MAGLKLASVTAAIAAVSVTGLTIKDTSAIPAKVKTHPVMYPRPNEFLTDLVISFDDITKTLLSASYNLHYVLCYKPIGEGRVFVIDGYADMMALLVTFCSKLSALADDVAGVEILPGLPLITSSGPVADPEGEVFHGLEVAFAISELYEV